MQNKLIKIVNLMICALTILKQMFMSAGKVSYFKP